MFVAFVLFAGLAGAQAAPSAAPASPLIGRAFMSPMGEPFFGRTSGEDGLVVWFAKADSDHDGSITSAEMVVDAERFFETLDTFKDGEIDPEEITRYETVIAPHLRSEAYISAQSLPGGGVEVDYDGESGAGRYSLLLIPEPVASADSNFNRGVSLEEFRKAAVTRFGLLDARRVGRLSFADLQEIRRAAASTARKRRSRQQAGPSNDPTSAEYGRNH